MTSSPTLLLSFTAGILAFLSPCILPLVPSYISFIGGETMGDETSMARRRVLLRTALFVLGFTMVFVTLGVVFSGSGLLFSQAGQIVNYIAGGIIVLLGANIIFDFWRFLNYEKRYTFSSRPAGTVGSLLIGMAFGAGWTPCIGPMLAGILLIAGTSGSVGTGILYLVAFSLGLGVPFLFAGAFLGQAKNLLERLKKHMRAVKIVSGVVLIIVGVLVAFGRLQLLTSSLLIWGVRLDQWRMAQPDRARIVGGIAILLLAVLPPLATAIRRRRGTPTGQPTIRVIASVVWTAALLTLSVLAFVGTIEPIDWLARWIGFTGL